MMVCGRFYSLRVESPSGYDILSISGFLPSPPHAAHGMRGGGQITRRKPVASATSLTTACTITSWGCGLTSAIPPPLLQHAAVLTRVECWMSVGPAGAFEQKPMVLPSAYPLTDCPMIISTCRVEDALSRCL